MILSKSQFPSPSDVRDSAAREEIFRRNGLLPEEEVRAVFRYGAIVGSIIHSFDTLERGMDTARMQIREHEKAGQSFPSGTVILAGSLSAGKGRFQRYWHAPQGGIWMTLVLVNTLLPEKSRLLPLVAGMACCETVNHFGVSGRIKWVNDVHVHGKKVAGILTESMVSPETGEEYLLIGMGLNVNNSEFPPELQALASSMYRISGKQYDTKEVAALLLAKLSWYVGLLHLLEEMELGEKPGADEYFERHFLSNWLKMSDSVGRKVHFGYDIQKNKQYEALVLGLEADGGLRMRNLEDNVEVTEYGGEIVYQE
ncbi:MAG: biotin--[acetyl-CoA-carboxylase] ligase [Desulfobulbaceae bacterium]|nr:biotin--[acetyl-CoA-carboxylase] ligase [Desulfobulbaceae bacterium]